MFMIYEFILIVCKVNDVYDIHGRCLLSGSLFTIGEGVVKYIRSRRLLYVN